MDWYSDYGCYDLPVRPKFAGSFMKKKKKKPKPKPTSKPEPLAGVTMTFGRHKGTDIRFVPTDYLQWMTRQDRIAQRSDAERELAYRTETETKPQESETKMATSNLFKVKADGSYGTFITEDGGEVLLRMPDNSIKGFQPSQIERVVPYTVAVSGTEGRVKHIRLPKNSVAEGDLLHLVWDSGFELVVVNKLNTRNERADRPSKVFKLTAEALEIPESVME